MRVRPSPSAIASGGNPDDSKPRSTSLRETEFGSGSGGNRVAIGPYFRALFFAKAHKYLILLARKNDRVLAGGCYCDNLAQIADFLDWKARRSS
jgi:hypothetical protein